MSLVSNQCVFLAATLVICLYISNTHSRIIRELDKPNRLPAQTKKLLKQEKQRLLDLNETDEIKEVKIIYDARRIPKILEKPRDENGDVIDGFDPIELPTDFASYDVAPVDGFIELQELILVTGAAKNVEAAFNATDVDGDGLINTDEFADAPWMLNAEISEPSTVEPQQLANISAQQIDGQYREMNNTQLNDTQSEIIEDEDDEVRDEAEHDLLSSEETEQLPD